MIGYVARDKDGDIYLYTEEPTYDYVIESWFSNNPEFINITGQFHEFDNMSYKDEPIKVEIKLEKV